ncbi:MAG: right-handed parallel beta-helix repeat-containing protein, partial [Chitinophagaceae bacterium]
MNKNYIILVLFFILLPFYSVLAQNTIWYVSPNGTGNGSTWALASNSVQTAISNAQPGDEVWVKQGSYQNAVGVAFSLKEGVAVYGGFPSTTNPTLADRNPKAYETILRGNQSRVIEAYGTWEPMTAATILDGFTIREGYSAGGAGIHMTNCNATFRNLKVTLNTSNVGLGAGILMSYSDATLIQVLVVNNTSILTTGFDGDTGGIRINGGTPKFYNSVIANNHAEGATGGISVTNTNCYFYNCIVYGNTADYVSPDVYMNANFNSGTNGVAYSSNCILQDCGGSEYFFEVPQFMLYGIDMGGNYDINPMFNADYSMQNAIGINKGNTQAYLALSNGTDKDYFNNNRVVDAIDIGLTEYQTVQSEILYVKENGTGTGSSWADASGDLQLMMNNQFKGKSVWVAEGTYYANDPYFRLRDSIKVYGGFPATGNPTFTDRNVELHPTKMTSSYYAVIGNFYPADKKLSSQTLVDGITITKHPNSQTYMYGLFENNSDAVYQNCNFTDLTFGVAEIRNSSQNTFLDCNFTNNTAINDDVVTVNVLTGGEATFLKCNFINNYAFQSAAIQVISNSNVWVDECLFANNANQEHTGNGKVFNVVDSRATITNSIFESNGTSAVGGNIMWLLGVVVPNNPTDTYPLKVTIDRCIFRDNLNSAVLYQGRPGDEVSISNSLFYKNAGSVGAGFRK